MENIYKITYYEYDMEDNVYFATFNKTVKTDKDEEHMKNLIDEWNEELYRRDIPGQLHFSTIIISPLEELSVHDFIFDISEL